MKALSSLYISSSKPRPYLVRSQDHIFSITFHFFTGHHQFTLELSQRPWQKRAPIRTSGPAFSTRRVWAAAGAADSQRWALTCCVGSRASLSPGQLTREKDEEVSSAGISYASPPEPFQLMPGGLRSRGVGDTGGRSPAGARLCHERAS